MFVDFNLVVPGAIDSIVLQSNTSRATLLVVPLGYSMLFTITGADLAGNFTLNYQQDTLRVITYADSSQYFFGPAVNAHMLVFGYPGCEIPTLIQGQSISAREVEIGNPRYFYLDNSPTLGAQNDTIGATAHISGKFYDVRDNLISYTLNDHNFALPVNVDQLNWGFLLFYSPLDVFSFDAQGNYSTIMLSRNNVITDISYLSGVTPYGYSKNQLLPCNPFNFFMEPGESALHDIHLADSTFLVGLNDEPTMRDADISIICAPNPVSRTGSFFISAKEPLENTEIIVRSGNGSVLLTLPVPHETKCRIEFDRHRLGAPGLCFFTLLQSGKAIKSGEIICL
jgi:hypothetical protein